MTLPKPEHWIDNHQATGDDRALPDWPGLEVRLIIDINKAPSVLGDLSTKQIMTHWITQPVVAPNPIPSS